MLRHLPAHNDGPQPVVHFPRGEPAVLALRGLLHDCRHGAADHQEAHAPGPSRPPGKRGPGGGLPGSRAAGPACAGEGVPGQREAAPQRCRARDTGHAGTMALPPRHGPPPGPRHEARGGCLPRAGEGHRAEDGERPHEDPTHGRGLQRGLELQARSRQPGLLVNAGQLAAWEQQRQAGWRGATRGQPPWKSGQHGRQRAPPAVGHRGPASWPGPQRLFALAFTLAAGPAALSNAAGHRAGAWQGGSRAYAGPLC
mmetsp:Transcript_57827/g.181576  ORF Transcript_57827/g.181576 Transcript_57827/m.181576 type:complete len:255 (-) Transcript_57827:849-1613(-)